MQAAVHESSSSPIVPRALVRLGSRGFDGLLGLKLARLYAFGVGVTYTVTALLSHGDPQVTISSWQRALGTASWVAGVGALSLSTNLQERDDASGLAGLARLRGFGSSALEEARQLAGCLRLISTVAVAGLLVALIAGTRLATPSGLWLTAKLVLASLCYAAVVGASLTLLARACGRAVPTRGRSAFLAVTLGPWLLGSVLGYVPNVPGAFSWLLRVISGCMQ